MSSSSFRIVPLDPVFVARVRSTLVDAHGNRLQVTRCSESVPCRFTLRYVESGEEAILLAYSPFARRHPYAEVGPVYVRREGAVGYEDVYRFPPEIDPRTRVFRAYDADERIVDACVGTADPDVIIASFFARTDVDCIHVRALTYGCFTFRIVRA